MDPIPALRKSIFPGIPPFINYVPMGGFTGKVEPGPQYWDEEKWDQDQLWRFTLAMNRWIDQCQESECKGSIAALEVANNCAEMGNRRIGTLARKQVSMQAKKSFFVFVHECQGHQLLPFSTNIFTRILTPSISTTYLAKLKTCCQREQSLFRGVKTIVKQHYCTWGACCLDSCCCCDSNNCHSHSNDSSQKCQPFPKKCLGYIPFGRGHL